MPWEQRGNQRYYYRKEKIEGRVVRTYFGRGEAAERAAAEDAVTKEHERLARERVKRMQKDSKLFALQVKAAVIVYKEDRRREGGLIYIDRDGNPRRMYAKTRAKLLARNADLPEEEMPNRIQSLEGDPRLYRTRNLEGEACRAAAVEDPTPPCSSFVARRSSLDLRGSSPESPQSRTPVQTPSSAGLALQGADCQELADVLHIDDLPQTSPETGHRKPKTDPKSCVPGTSFLKLIPLDQVQNSPKPCVPDLENHKFGQPEEPEEIPILTPELIAKHGDLVMEILEQFPDDAEAAEELCRRLAHLESSATGGSSRRTLRQ
jgi:hypothetical protein